MVRGEAAQDGVERPSRERQRFRSRLLDGDVGQAALSRCCHDNIQHGLRDITRDHLGHMGCCAIANVAAAASQVEHPCGAQTAHDLFHLVQVATSAVDSAGDVVPRPAAILLGDECVLLRFHG